MDPRVTFTVDDLWTPAKALPGRGGLLAIAARAGEAWECPDLTARVRVGYNGRLRTTLGRAVLDDLRVELNPRLLREHPAELVPTLVHELAHLVVHERYGRVASHGRHFRTLMAAVRLSPAATHKLPTAHLKRRRRRYLYLHRCSDCGYSFIARSVRRNSYCIACGPEMTWDIIRAPSSKEGRKHLTGLAAGTATAS